MTWMITIGDIMTALVFVLGILAIFMLWLLARLDARRARRMNAKQKAGENTLASDFVDGEPTKPVTIMSPEEIASLHGRYAGAQNVGARSATSSDPAMGPRSMGYAGFHGLDAIQSQSRVADICTNGGKRHNFQPRYSESSVPVVFKNLNLRQTKAVDLAKLITAQTTYVKAYHCDVCQFCGKVVNQQAQIAEARGPNGEKVIEVQVEGERI